METSGTSRSSPPSSSHDIKVTPVGRNLQFRNVRRQVLELLVEAILVLWKNVIKVKLSISVKISNCSYLKTRFSLIKTKNTQRK
jgi:hypothetical protein